MSHTPGPWRVFYDYVLTRGGGGEGELSHEIHAGSVHLARLSIYSREDDARLMAAAPDLLEALDLLLWQVESNDPGGWYAVKVKARAAIEKARGTHGD